MKKIVSLMLAAVLMLSALLPVGGLSAFAAGAQEIDAAEFASRAALLASKYDGDLMNLREASGGVRAAYSAQEDTDAGDETDFTLKRIILKADGAVSSFGAIDSVEGFNDVHIFQYATERDARAAYEYYSNSDIAEYVQADKIISLESTTENFGAKVESMAAPVLSNGHLSWGSEFSGFDTANAYVAENAAAAKEIVVAVIDSGVEETHEFFSGRIIPSTHNYSSTGTAGSAKDDNGHGTHVAGIIIDNTLPNVKVKGYKVLDYNGYGTISALCSGIAAATADNADVINLSLADSSTESAVDDFVYAAHKKGITVVAASGNESTNADFLTPAYISDVITVAACNSYNAVVTFSNYGNCVDIAAPGVDITSAYLGNSYASLNGTSMATPFVAAAAAVIYTLEPGVSPADVQARIKDGANALDNPARLSYAGSGILCAYDALDIPRLSPAAFSLKGGEYMGAVQVSMSCASENAKIYYTTDGSIPTESNGKLYTSPVTVSDYTKLSAVSVESGSFPSKHVTAFYRIRNYAPDSSLEISSAGVITAYKGSYRDILIRDTVKNIRVTGIAASAFQESEIMGVSLPEGVTAIPEYGFYIAQRLRYVEAPGVVTIGGYAFYSDINLRRVDAPKVTAIQKTAFFNCVSLESAIFDKLTSVASGAFEQTVRLVDASFASLEDIPSNLFENSGLINLNIPSAKTIERNAFKGCAFLSYLDLPSVTEVERGAFNETNLKRVDFSSLVTLNDVPSAGAVMALPSSYKSCGVIT
ncbi:MAG: S8 family serine peptidase, partial [Clostridiales bacterium]|nr:S8 family serine peptidase [Clostridiales bacterium]